jgi:hypothetical protein
MGLEKFNDPLFTFDEPSHTYRYGDKVLESGTTFIKNNFVEPFDGDTIAGRMATQAKSKEAILAEWKAKSERAMQKGTNVHFALEEHILGHSLPNMDAEETDLFLSGVKYWHSIKDHCQVVGVEQKIFDVEWGIAGTIDLLIGMNGWLYLMDWKTNAKFKSEGGYNQLRNPFNDQPENDLTKYSLQLSLYKLILERHGFKVAPQMGIIHVMPAGAYRRYWALDATKALYEFLMLTRTGESKLPPIKKKVA